MKKLQDRYKENDKEEIMIKEMMKKSKGKFDQDKFDFNYKRKVANHQELYNKRYKLKEDE